jgi:diguanylate cyclase (GGDEF)-like protein
MAKPPEILLLSDSPQQIQIWARMLAGTSLHLWQGLAALVPATVVDVIVTDRAVTGHRLPDPQSCSRLTRGEIGVILVGDEGSADVRLPSNLTPRELQLACMLLTEVIRLRRQCNRQRQMHGVLKDLAMRDPLTGLPNRRAWEDQLADWSSRLAEPTQQPDQALGICLAVIDLDHFKSINERCGHLVGDRVLRQVADRLAENTSSGTFVARLGGDEFGLIFPAADHSTATRRVENLRMRCCAEITPTLSASLGVAFGQSGRTLAIADVFQAADDALRQAKAAGRNRTVTAVAAASVATPGQNHERP